MQGRVVQAEPAHRGQALRRTSLVAEGEGLVACPPNDVALAGYAVPLDADDEASGPVQPLELDGDGVRWSGSGRHRLVLVHVEDVGFDYLSVAACAALVDSVHGEVERRAGDYLGGTIVGSFQDELPSMPTWSRQFAAQFAARRGYRIEPRLAELWEDAAQAGELRADYQRTRAELAEEAFFRPLFDWHDRRGLALGCDQQHPARVRW